MCPVTFLLTIGKNGKVHVNREDFFKWRDECGIGRDNTVTGMRFQLGLYWRIGLYNTGKVTDWEEIDLND